MPSAYILSGEIDVAALTLAFQRIVERHEILRTTIITEDGRPLQRIELTLNKKDVVQLLDLNDQNITAELVSKLAAEHASHIFNLEMGPLYKVTCAALNPGRVLLMLNFHHIISDGWSMTIVIDELLANYREFVAGNEIASKPLRVQYKDYVEWHESKMKQETLSLKEYWMQKLAGKVPKVLLPLDATRQSRQSFVGAHYDFGIDYNDARRLKEFCNSSQTTMFVPVLAALYLLLYSFKRQRHLVIGTPVSGRHHPDLQDQIGCYLNILPLYFRIDGHQPLRELIGALNRELREVSDYQDYPFDLLAQDLKSRQPELDETFRCGLSWNNFNYTGGSLPFSVEPVSTQFNVAKSDLWFYGMEGYNNSIQFNVEYNTEVFQSDTISQVVDLFRGFMSNLAHDPGLTIDEVVLNLAPEANVPAIEAAFTLNFRK